jgi:hypothetical protein
MIASFDALLAFVSKSSWPSIKSLRKNGHERRVLPSGELITR